MVLRAPKPALWAATALAAVSLALTACGAPQPASAPAPASSPAAQASPTTPPQTLNPSAASPVAVASPAASPGAAVASSAASPAAATSSAAAREGGVVTISMWSPPNNFSPINSDSSYGFYPISIMFDTLVTVDPNVKYVPKLAERWEFSADNRQVTFSINKNAKWTDGRPVTAQDYEFTLRTIANPQVETNRSNNISTLVGTNENGRRDGNAELGIKVLDDKTIQLTMKQPVDQLYVLDRFGWNIYVLPKHVLENVAPADLSGHEFFLRPSVTSGAFKFVRYETAQFVELERNPDYYLGRPKLDKVIIRIVQPQVAVAQLEKGEVDMTAGPGIGDISIDDWDRVKALPNIDAVSVPGTGYQYMDINVSNETVPKLADKRVRQALVYAINRQLIVDQLLKGQGVVANGPIASILPYYNKNLQQIPYDPQKARALLQEAGWDFNQEVQLSVPTGNLVRERSADIIKANLEAIGFKVRIQKMDFPSLQAEATSGKYQMRLVGWSPGFDPDVSSQYRAGGLYNYGKRDNPKLNDLLDRGRLEARFEARKEIYDAVQLELQEDAPVVFLYYPNALQAKNKRLQNVTHTGWTTGALWNIHEWWVTG